MQNKAFGSILIISILLLLSILVLKSEHLILNLLKLRKIQINNLLSKDEFNSITDSNKPFICIGKAQKICLLNSNNNFKIYNYNYYFNNFTDCQLKISAQPESFADQRPLTAGSISSNSTCQRWDNNFPLKENLFIDYPATSSGGKIISAGYINFNSDLNLSTDTEIIAGGDIFIRNLNSTEELDLYLHSNSGSIQILRKSPLINLQTLPPQQLLEKYIFGINPAVFNTDSE